MGNIIGPGMPRGFGCKNNTSLLIHSDHSNGSTDIADSSRHGHTITRYGGVTHSTAKAKFGGSSIYFDGTDDGIRIPHHASLEWGSGEFCIDWWMWLPGNPDDWDRFIEKGDGWTTGWHLYWKGPNWVLGYPYDSYKHNIGAFTLSQWIHVAIERVGSTIYVYEDGSEKATFSNSNDRDSADAMNIGRNHDGTDFTEAYIDEFRVCNRAMFRGEFTPPNRPYSP